MQNTAGNNYSMTTDETYLDDQWHSVVFVQNSTNAYLYVDNSLRKTASIAYPAAFGNNDAIGTISAVGYLDDFKFYGVSLTAQDVQRIYEEGFGPLLCWNYRARYKNSQRMYKIGGGGKFPNQLVVPKSVDVSTGMMIDEGKVINGDQFKIIQ